MNSRRIHHVSAWPFRQRRGAHSILATTAAALLLHRGGLDLHLSGGTRRRRWANPVLDLGGHGHECLLHVGRVLGRRLQEGDAQLISVLLKIPGKQINPCVPYLN
jgi:hypothetical protein